VHFDREEAMRRASVADHGVLATLGQVRGADLVPVCFSIVDEWLAVPIDSVKPKGSTALGRVRNLERDPRATLLVEHWDPEDWSRLWWVRLSLRRADPSAGPHERLVEGLRQRYAQYRDAPFTDVLVFRIEHVGGWSAA
jgi:PPOX class probable F420-dependent enzyme